MSAKAKSKLTPEQQKATMTRVLQKIKPYGFFVVCSLIVAAVSVAAQLYIPILCGSAIDMMLGKGAVDHAGPVPCGSGIRAQWMRYCCFSWCHHLYFRAFRRWILSSYIRSSATFII